MGCGPRYFVLPWRRNFRGMLFTCSFSLKLIEPTPDIAHYRKKVQSRIVKSGEEGRLKKNSFRRVSFSLNFKLLCSVTQRVALLSLNWKVKHTLYHEWNILQF
jgi:hypothetical protein